jgi:predicted transglutaminase-like cysteine proteinase
MRGVVISVLAALVPTAIAIQSVADAALSTTGLDTPLASSSLKFTINYPYPSLNSYADGFTAAAAFDPFTSEFSFAAAPFINTPTKDTPGNTLGMAWPDILPSGGWIEVTPGAGWPKAAPKVVTPTPQAALPKPIPTQAMPSGAQEHERTPREAYAPTVEQPSVLLPSDVQSPELPGRPLPQAAPSKLIPSQVMPSVTKRYETAPREAYASPIEQPPVVQSPKLLPLDVPSPELAHPQPPKTSRRKPVSDLAWIKFGAPTLAPMGHTEFCMKYPDDCRAEKAVLRGEPIDLTAERRAELVRVNAQVNRAIRPMELNESIADEKWLISPKVGDCHDYAVTKRHDLLALGWPASDLLLAEVVTSWGEHHLVVVVRTNEGDLVADSLSHQIRNWSKTPYQWVRVESPANPTYWETVKAPEPDVVAMMGHDDQL